MQAATHDASRLLPGPQAPDALHLAPTIYLHRAPELGAPARRDRSRATISLAGAASVPTMEWGPAPVGFPPGARMAVLQGDPTLDGSFLVRFRLPAGYEIAPHVRQSTGFVTVVSGALAVGLGASRRGAERIKLSAGAWLTIPAGQPHHIVAPVATVVQLDAIGPLELTYVHPATAPLAVRR